MREGRHTSNEMKCGAKGYVMCRLRKGAPLIRGAHSKY
jgi:hypothetical protein